MTLPSKIAAVLLALFVALMGTAWAVVHFAISPRFVALERAQNAREVANMQETIRQIDSDLRGRVLDYARWDDTYAYLNGRLPRFIQHNFAPGWFEAYDVDFMLIADDEGRVLWSGARDDGLEANNHAVNAMILDWRSTERADPLAAAGGVVWTAAGPLAFAAAAITDSEAARPPRGLVLLGKRITREALERRSQLSVRLLARAAPVRDLDLAAHLRHFMASGAEHASWSETETLNSLIALHAANGRVVGAVLAERPRDITALGARAGNTTLLVAALSLAIAVFALWFLAKHFLVRRLAGLDAHLRAQTPGSPLRPMAAEQSEDEIGRLIRSYNAMTQRLSQAVARERAAESERDAEASASQMKSAFLANLSHELRTPLNAIIGYSELVEEDMDESNPARADIRRIKASSRHLLALINEILDLSRIESGAMTPSPHAFNVVEMLSAVEDAVRPLAASRGNTLTIEADPALGVAYTDELRLRQCLLNVVANACKFTDNGEITIAAKRLARETGDELLFEVRDTGVGMNADQLGRIFEPFVTTRTDLNSDGAGLGLALTRKLVRMLGGEVTARSVEGRGTTFVLTARANLSEPAPADARAA